jgi:hypothetical protein
MHRFQHGGASLKGEVMSGTKREARSEVQRIANRVRRTVDEGVGAVEEIHKRVVSLPLDVLERNRALASTARDLRRLQDRAIGAAYDLVRGVNRNVVKLAKAALQPPRPRKPRAQRKPAKKVAPPPSVAKAA